MHVCWTKFNVKIKIALSKDEVRILIKILVGDYWAFLFRGSNIDNLNATNGWTEPIVVLLFKAMVPGSVSECQDIGSLQPTPNIPNVLTLENVGTDLGQCLGGDHVFVLGKVWVGNFTSSKYEGPMVSYQNLD